jgi:hypothetical protein
MSSKARVGEVNRVHQVHIAHGAKGAHGLGTLFPRSHAHLAQATHGATWASVSATKDRP